MDDFISRKAAIECAIDAVDDWDGGYSPERERCIREHMAKVPSVDAVQVVHARWIDVNPDIFLDPRMKCSVCTAIESPLINWNYCPVCGAKMDGERGESE